VRKAISVLLAMALTIPAGAQSVSLSGQAEAPAVTLRAEVRNRTVAPGAATTVAVEASVASGLHIQSHTPTESWIVPTELTIRAPAGWRVGPVRYPAAEMKTFAFAQGKKLAVYGQKAVFLAEVTAPAAAKPGSAKITATLSYQACSDTQCLSPDKATAEMVVSLGARTSAALDSPLFAPQKAVTSSSERQQGNYFTDMASRHGWLALALAVYAAGLALSLTPCVFPLIPITLGYFRNQASGGRARTTGLALAYAGGLATTYSALGVAAASSGAVFGTWLQNPLVLAAFAALIGTMGVAMFGLFEIRPPAFITDRSGARGGGGGAFLMGMLFGFVAAPCTGPATVALLAFVGALGRPVLGFLLFFFLAMGIASPLVVLAIFSGSLPRTGAWSEWVKKLMGALMLGVALWLASPLLGAHLAVWLGAALAAALGVWLGFVERSGFRPGSFAAARVLTGLGGVTVAVWLLLPQSTGPAIQWQPYSDAALAQAAGRPVIIDFSADWCAPCHELEAGAFRDTEAVKLSGQFVRLRADMTASTSKEVETLRRHYQVRGLPAIVFIRPDGTEAADARVLSNVTGAELVRRMRQALAP